MAHIYTFNMKTKEIVQEHLLNVAYTPMARAQIKAFLVGAKIKARYEKMRFLIDGSKTFEDFVKWYEGEESFSDNKNVESSQICSDVSFEIIPDDTLINDFIAGTITYDKSAGNKSYTIMVDDVLSVKSCMFNGKDIILFNKEPRSKKIGVVKTNELKDSQYVKIKTTHDKCVNGFILELLKSEDANKIKICIDDYIFTFKVSDIEDIKIYED